MAGEPEVFRKDVFLKQIAEIGEEEKEEECMYQVYVPLHEKFDLIMVATYSTNTDHTHTHTWNVCFEILPRTQRAFRRD